MSEFNFKKRPLDTSGVWFSIDDPSLGDDSHFGKFKVKYRDERSTAHLVAVNKRNDNLTDEERKKLNGKLSDESTVKFIYQKIVEFFVDNYLVGWELADADGKSIPFSKDTAKEFFSDEEENRWILEELADRSVVQANFIVKNRVKVAKNS